MDIQSKAKSVFREIGFTVFISLIIYLLFSNFIAQPHRVKGTSMMPNFHDGELLLTEKISYRFSDPARGDVVVFRSPAYDGRDLIKRIIGLPGNKVRITDGVVYINDINLVEPYETQQTRGNLELTLAQNEYFVLGDNRISSSDSRSFGTVEKKYIVGRTWLVYWPVFKNSSSFGLRMILGVDYGIPDLF